MNITQEKRNTLEEEKNNNSKKEDTSQKIKYTVTCLFQNTETRDIVMKLAKKL